MEDRVGAEKELTGLIDLVNRTWERRAESENNLHDLAMIFLCAGPEQKSPPQVTSVLDPNFAWNIIQRMLNYFSETPPTPPVKLDTLADRLKALAEPKRLLIFNLLMEGVQCNCELGDFLDMPPNLISHHLSKLRAAGLVDAERDAVDSRWIYYSVNRAALDELNSVFGTFFDPARIKPRRIACGPRNLISIPETVEESLR